MTKHKQLQSKHFSSRILQWFHQHGRKHLPWQQHVTPYRVWLSEIMLQQTQVNTVIPYYQRFLQQFPSVEHLAKAPVDDVLTLWAGLGYYARARNLHKTAHIIHTQFNNQFPTNSDELEALPGIGRSTAAAILSLALGQSHAILDGNVKRVLARHFEIKGWAGKATVLKQLWQLSSDLTPQKESAFYNQAMMDIGATICTRTNPKCAQCCLKDTCLANKNDSWKHYPSPKPKKKNPLKQTYLVLLKQQQKVYLEKRPSNGIWGGLWSFPEFNQKMDALEWAQEQAVHHDKITHTIHDNAKQHKFSHYDLLIHLLVVQCDELKPAIQDKEIIFITQEKINDIGLATPIKSLIQEYGFTD